VLCVLRVSRSAALRLGFSPGSDIWDWDWGGWFGVQRNETFFFFAFFAGMLCYASTVRRTQRQRKKRRAHVGWRLVVVSGSQSANVHA
jgi:hypothetical protein